MEEIRTNDLALAAYLHARGYDYSRVDGEPNKRYFVFSIGRQKFIELSAEYGSAPCPVSASRLLGSFRSLKSALFR